MVEIVIFFIYSFHMIFLFFRKGDPAYMFDQRAYPAMGVTGHTKYREYSNPGFIVSSNMPRE